MAVAFILFVFSAPEHKFDLEYLTRQWAGKFDFSTEGAEKELEERFIETDPDEISNISEGCSSVIPVAYFQEAKRFAEEAETHQWIRCQNVVQGLAPSPKLVMQFRRRRSAAVPTSADTVSTTLSFKAGEKKWVQRFRRRWKLALGRVPVGEVVPLETLRQKVPALGEPVVGFVIFGSRMNPYWARNEDRIVGLVSGPPNNATTNLKTKTRSQILPFSLSGAGYLAMVELRSRGPAQGQETLGFESRRNKRPLLLPSSAGFENTREGSVLEPFAVSTQDIHRSAEKSLHVRQRRLRRSICAAENPTNRFGGRANVLQEGL